MAFNIRIPFVIASHVKKFTSSASFKDKSKAAAVGLLNGQLQYHNGTSVIPVTQGPTTASGGTTRTLVASASGSTNLFDSAAGITYTLPAPVVGLVFDFLWTVLQTSSAHVVVTDAGTTFLNGAVTMFSGEDVTPSATLGPKQYAGNGTTHIKTTTNGTTTGGGIGGWMRFRCTAATLWTVTGNIKSPSGTLATIFST